MSQETVTTEEIPNRIKEALVAEYGDSQDRCVRGYIPTQSIQLVMEYLDPEQIQAVTATRTVKDTTESFTLSGGDLPQYVSAEEQLKRDITLEFDRAKHKRFDWDRVLDFVVDADLGDLAIHKLVLRMENTDLRDHLFTLLQNAIGYPSSYAGEFTTPFYFVMESRAPELNKDYDNIKQAHDDGYLKQLGWNPRCLDLMAIWSHNGWTKSGNTPFAANGGVTQHEVEELAFNQRSPDEPVFAAVYSPLVVNRWQEPFGSSMTDMRHYEWEADQQGWVRNG